MDTLRSFAFILPMTFIATACSPGADPVARGSAHYRVQGCLTSYGGIGADRADVGTGVPDVPTSDSPSNYPGVLVSDGELSETTQTEYKVRCEVKGNAGGNVLTLSGRLDGPNVSPSAADPNSSTFVSIEAALDAPSGIGSGTVGFYTTDTLGATPVQNTSCEIIATPMPLHACSDELCTGESREPGETGRMWLQFNCPEMKVEATGMETAGCRANGTIVMERCTVGD